MTLTGLHKTRSDICSWMYSDWLKVKMHVASIMDRDSTKPLLKQAKELLPRLSHMWLSAGYDGRARVRTGSENALGLTAEVVRHLPKVRYVWVKEGKEPDWEKIWELLLPPGFQVLARKWIVERTFSWIHQKRRMSKAYESPQSRDAL